MESTCPIKVHGITESVKVNAIPTNTKKLLAGFLDIFLRAILPFVVKALYSKGIFSNSERLPSTGSFSLIASLGDKSRA